MAILETVNSGRPIRRIGLPRALLHYRYGALWETFFQELGYETIVSGPTTKAILEAGDRASIDEACLASKVYLGHVAQIADEVDAFFIPSLASVDHRKGFCTKFQSLPDMVDNTFRDQKLDIISLSIDDATDEKRTQTAYLDMATRLGALKSHAKKAYKKAVTAQAAADEARAAHLAETVSLVEKYRKVAAGHVQEEKQVPPLILIVAHPYIAHDRYISGDIEDAIERSGGVIAFADEHDHAKALKRSYGFSETLPWLINRELAGATLELADVIDGIVSVSAFPCGPDSLFTDALMRRVGNVPLLHLTIDAQSGSAGVQTRIESFIDILRFKKEGGYLDA